MSTVDRLAYSESPNSPVDSAQQTDAEAARPITGGISAVETGERARLMLGGFGLAVNQPRRSLFRR